MKKVGLLIFISALAVGIIFSNALGFGRFNFIKFGSIQGSGNSKTEGRNVSGFSKINVSGAINVEIIAQKDFSVDVEADDNLLENIKTVVDGDTLKIYTKGSISTRNPMTVRISMPSVERLNVSGASKANVSNVSTELLEVRSSGASKIKLDGVARVLNLDVNGASKVDAENLKVENGDLEASGASSIIASVSGQLKADASGASKIVFVGNPTNIDKKATGASSVVGR